MSVQSIWDDLPISQTLHGGHSLEEWTPIPVPL